MKPVSKVKKKVCFVCLKRFRTTENDTEEHVVGDNDIGDDIPNLQKDLYTRFLIFLSRYFKLKSTSQKLLERIKERKNEAGGSSLFCDECRDLILLICDMHSEIEGLKIRLNWKLGMLADLMHSSSSRISKKLGHGLIKDIAEQMACPSAKYCNLLRKVVVVKCRGSKRSGTLNPLVPVGLFPEYWTFGYGATKTILKRLIVIFVLGSSKILQPPIPIKIEPQTEETLECETQQAEGQCDIQKKRRRISRNFEDVINKCTDEEILQLANNATVEVDAAHEDFENTGYDSPPNDIDMDNNSDPDWSDTNGVKPRRTPRKTKWKNTETESDTNSDEGIMPEKCSKPRKSRRKVCGANIDVENNCDNLSDSELIHQLLESSGKRAPRKDRKSVGRPRVHPARERRKRMGRVKKLQSKSNSVPIKPPRCDGKIAEGSEVPEGARECEICHENYADDAYLLRHLKFVHEKKGEKSIQCCYCISKFVHQQTHNVHVEREHDLFRHQKFVCDADGCVCYFETVAELNAHLQEHAEDEMKTIHHCPTCNWGFLNPDLLELHHLYHSQQKKGSFGCRVCDKTFSTVLQMVYHVNVDHGKDIPLFKCCICGKKYKTRQRLQLHQSGSHQLELKPRSKAKSAKKKQDPQALICDKCPKVFKSKDSLKKHLLRVHGPGSKVFNCTAEGCTKVFKYSKNLQRHIDYTHCEPGANKVICDLCGAELQADYLKNHMIYSHGNFSAECHICHAKFKRRKTHRDHMKRHMPIRPSWKCNVCGKSFLSDSGLRYHKHSVHTPDHMKKFCCAGCSKRFSRPTLYRMHLKSCALIPGNQNGPVSCRRTRTFGRKRKRRNESECESETTEESGFEGNMKNVQMGDISPTIPTSTSVAVPHNQLLENTRYINQDIGAQPIDVSGFVLPPSQNF